MWRANASRCRLDSSEQSATRHPTPWAGSTARTVIALAALGLAGLALMALRQWWREIPLPSPPPVVATDVAPATVSDAVDLTRDGATLDETIRALLPAIEAFRRVEPTPLFDYVSPDEMRRDILENHLGSCELESRDREWLERNPRRR